MMFTGKNKESFERWYNTVVILDGHDRCVPITLDIFYQLPFSMQSGVMLEYLDSVDIDVNVETDFRHSKGKFFQVYLDGFRLDIGDKHATPIEFSTRQEALKEAIKKADEILNNQ